MCARATPAPRGVFSQRALHGLQLILLDLPELNMCARLFCCRSTNQSAKKVIVPMNEYSVMAASAIAL
jgi:hypothetical protein